ncbi:DNA repair protein RecO (recombination protein O) [Enterococcus sp. PF1-24]|uniref:DNA repair protein RecO n=1 Tax=unclassified Enterococcus TaxID=2608891 RepID=UPI002473D633|nr:MULTISPECIES: DNA repair protein RecO [unclassified Enterococcus]MDH6365119.1 DNA repair protein RecO (recombination protein O) [Enterococcus sp. PFB1-1]MDH6402220.1 DNA repair protein RecO (recombination protein O) [Enterococcus sp. PF1-24]
MANFIESKGLILFSKDHKEKDKLVKIFTESAGKMMFYVKGAHRKNNPLTPALLPFTEAVYFGDFRSDGLSFLNGAKEITAFRKIQEDIFISAYATYLLALTDAAIEDRTYDPHLYSFLKQSLQMMNEGYDEEIITNIFEVQLLNRFGVSPNWTNCAICGETHGKFDYSVKYHGVLCERHWLQDPHRFHSNPRAVHFLRMFSGITLDKIENISLQTETKESIRQLLDQLYDEYVGIHLKSKKFIDQMKTWQDVLKK